MPTAPRARTIRLFAAALVGSASVMAGLTAGCGGSGKQASAPPSPAAAAPPQPRLPSNAPEGGQALAPPPVTLATPGVPPATPPPHGQQQQQQQAARPPAGGQNTAVAATAPPAPVAARPVPAPPAATMPPIPADAQWTISCYPVQGPAHVEDSKAMKQALVQKTKRTDWYIVHGKDQSNLYFGFYRSVDPTDRKNAAEVTRAQADLRIVQEVRDKVGNAPFARGAFVSLDAPDPTAVAEWNLFNVDRALAPRDERRAFWSLQIMAFRGDKLRKEAAVGACRTLREQGVEAYYHHGEAVSSVTVGKWPASAVKAQNRTDESKDVAAADPGTNLVVTNVPLPDSLEARPLDGRRSVSVALKLEVQDPTLTAAMRQFPYHAVNYDVGVTRTQDGREIEDPSFLVEIPRAKGNGLYDSPDPDVVAAEPAGTGWGRRPGAAMINPTGPGQTGPAYGANRPSPRAGAPRPPGQ